MRGEAGGQGDKPEGEAGGETAEGDEGCYGKDLEGEEEGLICGVVHSAVFVYTVGASS